MVSRSEFYEGFLAYLPVTVHPKVFEISKHMPGVLLCTFLPCCNIWVDVFQNVCPTVNDIALYFFPGKFERYVYEFNAQALIYNIFIDDSMLI